MIQLQLIPYAERAQLGTMLVTYLAELQPYDPTYPPVHAPTDYMFFNAYWTESRVGTPFEGEERFPFFIQNGATNVGFALIRAVQAENKKRWQVAEFYIQPECRGKGYGKAAITVLFEQFGPNWELQALTANTLAVKFWDATLTTHAKQVVKTQPVPSYWQYRFQV